MDSNSEFAIIGAGVAGLSAAIALKSINRDFKVFEQASELKGIGAGFGLAANAMQALDYLDLKSEVENIGYYLDSYRLLDQKGKQIAYPNTKTFNNHYDQKNFSIHRADLHLFLLSKLNQANLHLGKKAVSLHQTNQNIQLIFDDGSIHVCKYLIIADGVKSNLRQQLVPSSVPRYSGYTCWRAVIENNNSINLSQGSETWGTKGRFGMSPLVRNRIYWYACVNSKPNNEQFRQFTVSDLQKHFYGYHDPIHEILSKTKNEDLIWGDILDIKPLKHFAFNNILLIGDAGHACTPNMGQGACQALEDVAVLLNELKQNKTVSESFKSFEKRRLKRTKYVIENSKLIGEISQLENSFLISIRNMMMRNIPDKLSQKVLIKLFSEDFMK